MSRTYKTGIIAVTLALLTMTQVTPAAAFSIKWTDSDGVIHMTNDIRLVPEEYRGSSVAVNSAGQPDSATADTPNTSAGCTDSSMMKKTAATGGKWTVPLIKHGEAYFVEVDLNDSLKSVFLLDTGASFTGLTPETAKRIGVAGAGTETGNVKQLHTANGKIVARSTNICSVAVGGAHVTDIDVVIHPISLPPGENIGGVLGLNFLSKFAMSLDLKNETLTLEHQKP